MTEFESTPTFIPIDERADTKNGYKLVISTIEGPNGVGKSAVHDLTLDLLDAAHYLSWQKDTSRPSVIGIAEPPYKGVSEDSMATWRGIAKSWDTQVKTVTKEMFEDPFFQMAVFMWGRRDVEKEAVERFPVWPNSMTTKYIQLYWEHPTRIENIDYKDMKMGDVREVGIATLLKDRGTGSTLRYQGTHPTKGEEVRRKVTRLYDDGFVRKENMTILLLASAGASLYQETSRDDNEPDRYSDPNNGTEYQVLMDWYPIFSNRLVRLYNDPAGEMNTITDVAMASTILTIAAEQEALGKLRMKEGEILRVPFPLKRITQLMESIFRKSEFRPVLAYSFRSYLLQLQNADLTRQNFKREKDFLYINGDFAITDFDKDNDEWVEFVIEPDLYKKV